MKYLTHQEDIDLLARIQQGDQDAMTEFHAVYKRLVFSTIWHILGNWRDTEEVAQDVFFYIWSHSHKWDSTKGHLGSWLKVIARYRAISRQRKDWRWKAVAFGKVAYRLPSHLCVGNARQDDVRIIRALVKALPAHQRKVITLSYFDGMTRPEIVRHLGLCRNTVEGQLYRGLKNLRVAWREANDDLANAN